MPFPEPLASAMRRLEELDARGRIDGTPRERRLRQISPELGRFLRTLVATAPR